MTTKERPILFSGEMVRAILEGRKTQTRRVLRTQPLDVIPYQGELAGQRWVGLMQRDPNKGLIFKCKYGQAGDRLWVRESWRIDSWSDDGEVCVQWRADEKVSKWITAGEDYLVFERLWIQSSDDCERSGLEFTDDGGYSWENGHSPCRWRPSIHMPRWASRITLEIVNVRVERVQDTSERDAIAEGIDEWEEMFRCGPDSDPCWTRDARHAYAWLWDSINARRGYGWDVNPWVWVIEFKQVTP